MAANLKTGEPPAPLGIIGGTGLYALPQFTPGTAVPTPFGLSAPLSRGAWGGRPVVFLPRHGRHHGVLPSEINARANIYALKAAGVRQVVAVSAVGSLAEAIAPGHTVVVDQFIDMTHGRPRSFFGDGVVAHVSLANPTCVRLRQILAATAAGFTAVHTGTYLCIEGPQFSTRAESHLWRAWGAHLVGMTALPEARLAREAELCYALVALPTDYDAWRPHTAPVTAAAVAEGLASATQTLLRWLPNALSATMDEAESCPCQSALDHALLTPATALPDTVRERVGLLLTRRFGPP